MEFAHTIATKGYAFGGLRELLASDSLGAYIKWQPRPGRTDSAHHCISNIRAEGLRYTQAATQLVFYLNEARPSEPTGEALKEASRTLTEGWGA